jgi:hypothetical protein
VRIEWIELSTGNVLEEEGFDWKAEPDRVQVSRMAHLAVLAAHKAIKGSEALRLKIRILGVVNASSIREKDSDHSAALLDKLLIAAPRSETGFQKYATTRAGDGGGSPERAQSLGHDRDG